MSELGIRSPAMGAKRIERRIEGGGRVEDDGEKDRGGLRRG